MERTDLLGVSHRRYNPLTQDWVLVSPNRATRPWQGQTEKHPPQASLPYDSNCYLCPGNQRAGGIQNPAYATTFVFDNDFAALTPDLPNVSFDEQGTGLIIAATESGVCRVVCFSPRHDLTLATMAVNEVRNVVDVWATQFRELGQRPSIDYVQIFENRGEMMGCSNPHPHGQIWASQGIPNEPRKEQASFAEHWVRCNRCLICDYLSLEEEGIRIVCENEFFVVVVPFWATWPFEVLLASRRHVRDICELDGAERDGLAEILKCLTARYDRLFQISFPYSMGWHQRPTDGREHEEWHCHAHFFPPLLRSASVRKFMVGYELLASPQRDITPEAAAGALRQVSDAK